MMFGWLVKCGLYESLVGLTVCFRLLGVGLFALIALFIRYIYVGCHFWLILKVMLVGVVAGYCLFWALVVVCGWYFLRGRWLKSVFGFVLLLGLLLIVVVMLCWLWCVEQRCLLFYWLCCIPMVTCSFRLRCGWWLMVGRRGVFDDWLC